MLEYYLIILLLVAGFGSGLIVSISSGTAGAILIPTLTIFLGHSVHKAIGTNLIVDCVIGITAGLIFIKKGKVDFKSAIILAITGSIGALIGSRYTSAAPESGLNFFIAILLLILGFNLLINGVTKNVNFIKSKFNFEKLISNKNLIFMPLGFLIGLVSGFSGLGGGGIVAIILVFFLDYDVHTAIGTSLIMTFFIAGSGAAGHIINNEYILNLAIIASIAAAIGAITGSLVANKIDEDKLGRLIGLIVIILGIILVIRLIY